MKGCIKEEHLENLPQCYAIYQLRNLHERNGGYFFTEGAMRSFNSRIHTDVYGGCVFVTSEKNRSWRFEYPRLYTVRYMDGDGNTHTVGDFQGFETRSKAHTFAKNLGEWIEKRRE